MIFNLKIKGCILIFIGLFVFFLGINMFLSYQYRARFKKIPLSSQESRASLIKKYYCLLSTGQKIPIGITKNDVKSILGDPQNSDDEYVWIWIYDYKDYTKTNKELLWKNMCRFSDGFGIVFEKEKTISTIFRLIVDSPEDIYANHRGIPFELGKNILDQSSKQGKN